MEVEQLKTNRFVKKAIPKLPCDINKQNSGKGRKKRYTPQKMRKMINEYFTMCETEDDIPSIKGMMIHMQMYKDQFYKYLEYPDFTNMLEHARLIISEWCEKDVYKSQGLCAGKIQYMKNVHDWVEKTESVVTQRVTSIEEARAKIEMLAPKLMEMLRNPNVTNQLVIEGKVVEQNDRRV